MSPNCAVMAAVDLIAPRRFAVVREPIPALHTAHDILVRVRAVGICGSDIGSYIGRPDRPFGYPFRLGHEFSAEIVRVGSSGLEDSHGKPLEPGTLVGVDPNRPCMKCEMCEHGRQNLCLASEQPPFQRGGALSEYLSVPHSACFALSNSVNASDAALIEPLAVAIHVVDRAQPRLGDDVVVLGAGPIGSLIARLVSASGTNRVFVFDRFDWRLAPLAKCNMITKKVDDVDVITFVQSQTNGRGVDIVIEAAWMDDSVQQAIGVCKVGGKVLFVGTPRYRDSVEFVCSPARRKGLAIEFIRRTNQSFSRAVRLVEEKKVDVANLVSHVFPFSEVAAAFEINAAYAPGVRKVLIDVSQQ